MSLLTHAELALAKSRRSLEDLNALIAHAEETLGEAPLVERLVDAEGNDVVAEAEEVDVDDELELEEDEEEEAEEVAETEESS